MTLPNTMVITNARYKPDHFSGEITSIIATINDVECLVPIADDNYDYREIKRRLDAGTLTIADAD
jgi:hypothetical protein